MTKSIASVEANQNMAALANQVLALSKISGSGTPRMTRRTRILQEEFVRLMLSHQKIQRCDDRAHGLRGLMDPTTGNCFFVEEEDLLSPKKA